MTKLRIGYLGDGPWASLALDQIRRAPSKFEVAFIVPRFESKDPDLEKMAVEIGCPFLVIQNINTQESIATIEAMNIDLLVSMSFNQIMKSGLIRAARLGAINCHAGDLPRYRGRNVINWAIINGEEELGITVHRIDEGIDSGAILAQSFVDIRPEDSYAEVLQKAIQACPALLLRVLNEFSEGEVSERCQSEETGFYCGRRGIGDEWIDWRWPAHRIHNFIRGISNPGPGAYFAIDGSIFAAHKSSLIDQAPEYIGTPGEVVGRNQDGVIVKVEDTLIHISLCADPKGLGQPFHPKWPIGTRLVGRTEHRISQLERLADFSLE